MTDPNDPAFPTDNATQTSNHTYHFVGMTKREYFAGQIMMGLMQPDSIRASGKNDGAYSLARVALECDDALIAELNK